MKQRLDHSKQALAWRLRLCQQSGRPLGFYAEALYDTARGLGLTSATLNYFYLAGLDKPVSWDRLGDLRTWFYWDLVDHVIAQRELELEIEEWASHSARLAVPVTLNPVVITVPRTFDSLPGISGLVCKLGGSTHEISTGS